MFCIYNFAIFRSSNPDLNVFITLVPSPSSLLVQQLMEFSASIFENFIELKAFHLALNIKLLRLMFDLVEICT